MIRQSLQKNTWKKGIFLLEQYQLLYTNDSIPQINNHAALLTELQEPERAMAALRKLAQTIKEYNSDTCLDYALVQESRALNDEMEMLVKDALTS